MFLSLWNYFRGYVIIEVSGFSVERFINLAVHKGIYIWDINHKGSVVTMKVSIKGFFLLKSCCKKTGCRIKIAGKKGYPFTANKYRKRKFFMVGVVFFVLVLYALSSFVWLIEVEGNERITADQILKYCEENGLYAGSFKYTVDTKAIEKNMINSFSDLSWITIQIKGTKAVIKLTETIPKVEIIDNNTPCDVVASKDGLIVSIVTSAGTPVVKAKDVVQEGDVLVSGEIIVKEDEMGIIKEYTNAKAEVKAKLWNEFNFFVPLIYNEKIFSGNTVKGLSLIILDRPINLYKPKIAFENYEKTAIRQQLKASENYVLPIVFIIDEYREFTFTEKTKTIEEAMDDANKIITGRIIREFDFKSDIMDKSVEFTQEDDKLAVKAIVTVIEQIDTQKKISNDGGSTNNDGEQSTNT